MVITLGMRLLRTENDLLVMGPGSVSEGDEVWVLKGARVPFVLRPNQETGRYQLIGQSYVRGTMQGEAPGEGQPAWKCVELE